MKLAIVILNWNGAQLLEQFLPSVVQYSKNADIYVADNASTDNSIAFIKSTFPSVKIIQNTVNGGYAKGYNDALKHVNTDVFCLLNSDVEVSKGWLSSIINTFETEPNTAIIQPKILDYKQKDYFEYAGAGGGFIDKYGYPYCRGRIFNTIEKDTGQYDNSIEVLWASGACLFIKKSVFNELKGFDESFFAHMEEIDLCWRARNLGHIIKYVGTSKIYHLGGATLNASNPKKTYLNFRNSLYTLIKNAQGNIFALVITRLFLDGIAGIKFLIELKPKHMFAIIKAHVSFYINVNRYIKQRKTLCQSSTYYSKTSIVWRYFVLNKTEF